MLVKDLMKKEGTNMSLDIYLVDRFQTEGNDEQEIYWQGNITHNLNKIAIEVGVYEYLWRPDEIGIIKAKDNIENLRFSLILFYIHYEKLEELNLNNGWGSLVGLIDFTNEYFKACMEYPEALIEVSR